jgi:hypothetical protein
MASGDRPGSEVDGEAAEGTDSDAEGSHDARVTRRETLLAGGALGVAAGGGYAGWHALRDRGDDAGDAASGREDFLWVRPSAWRNERFYENLLAFARRYDLSMAYGPPSTNAPGVGEEIAPALEAAGRYGVDPWFNVGVFDDVTAEQFVRGGEGRRRHLEGLREVARTYDEVVGGGRVILWQEAPVMGNWAEGAEWNEASVENLLEYGPAAFDAQKSALQEANPDLDVGVFVHFPYVVDSKRPEVFADLAEGLRERGAMPEFGFADYYRGWYEKDVGPDPADAAVRSLVSNAREHLAGRDVFYLGQAHTINPGHTPSAQAMRSNLRASLDAGAAGVGWYMSGRYKPTTQGFDPFVPNVEGAEFGTETTPTPMVARDRYQYAWTATLESRPDVSPDDRFDLWLRGDAEGFDYHAHRVAARTAAGDWALVGDADGYLDGDYPYADVPTTVFRALERDRFVVDGQVELRIDTREAADPESLRAVLAMPWAPEDFVTAREATALLEGTADVAAHALGGARPDRTLSPGETARVTLPVGNDGSLTPLVRSEHAGAVRQLATAEEHDGFDPDGRFDLWLAGDGLADPGVAPPLRDRDGAEVHPAAAAVAAVSSPEVALYYGLDRERFLGGGLYLAGDPDDGARVELACAMPYAGRANFRSPSRARALLTDQPEAAETFSVAWNRPS